MKRKLNKILITLLTLLMPVLLFPQKAMIQLIHNSADHSAKIVDVYVNNELLLSNFRFRTATPFVEVQANVPLKVTIVGKSNGSFESRIWESTVTFERDHSYIVIANGLTNDQDYKPFRPFAVYPYAGARSSSVLMGIQTDEATRFTDILVFHGSTDAPAVDVSEVSIGVGNILSNLTYGSFAGYLSVPTDDYVLQLTSAADQTPLARYAAPLKSLGLEDMALTLVASGFINPESNSGGPSFGLFAVLPSGGDFIPLPVSQSETISIARLQVIHNSADAAAAMVDVWLNDTKLLENFPFRHATPFIDAPAGVEFTISLKAPGSTTAENPLWSKNYVLEAGKTYILVANGIISTSGYNPIQPFDIYIYPSGREFSSSSDITDVLVFHGSTDAPKVTVWETGIGAGQIIQDFDYGEFAGYLSLPAQDYTLQIRDENGNIALFTYSAPLQNLGLGGTALTVLASGFVDPSSNNNGSPFGLYVALPSGGSLIPLSGLSNIPSVSRKNAVNIYPNPAKDFIQVNINSERATTFQISIINILGSVVKNDLIFHDQGNSFYSVSVNDLPEGIYIVDVSGENQRFAQKIRIIR